MKKIVVTIYALLFMLFVANTAYAANLKSWNDPLNSGIGDIYKTSTTSAPTIPTYLGSLYKWTPMLGITFIIQIVLAGYEWMTAGGEAAKVDEARKRILHAVIGISILLGLYVITYFLIHNLSIITGMK